MNNFDQTIYTMNNNTSNQLYNNYQYYDNQTSSTTNIQWTTTITGYIPYYSNLNYTYDDTLHWDYRKNDYGLREYLFANDSYKEISEALEYYYYKSDDNQEFEDNLYRLTLDLLYEHIKDVEQFQDFFNEESFRYSEINKIIQEIINRYHTLIEEELYG